MTDKKTIPDIQKEEALEKYNNEDKAYNQQNTDLAIALFYLPIFSVASNNNALDTRQYVRVSDEVVSYKGITLCPKRHFPLLNFIYSKASLTGNNTVVECKKVMRQIAGYNRTREEEMQAIFSMLESLQDCKITIKRYNGKKKLVERYTVPLMGAVAYDGEMFYMEISRFLTGVSDAIWTQRSNMELYGSLKNNFSKTLLLFYESIRFTNTSTIGISFEIIKERLQSKMGDKNLRANIKKAHDELVKNGYLEDAYTKGRGLKTIYYIVRKWENTKTNEPVIISEPQPFKSSLKAEDRRKRSNVALNNEELINSYPEKDMSIEKQSPSQQYLIKGYSEVEREQINKDWNEFVKGEK